jgi:hypothetical protein
MLFCLAQCSTITPFTEPAAMPQSALQTEARQMSSTNCLG